MLKNTTTLQVLRVLCKQLYNLQLKIVKLFTIYMNVALNGVKYSEIRFTSG